MNVNGILKVHPSTAAYRALKVSTVASVGSTAQSDAAQNVYEGAVLCKKDKIAHRLV